MAVLSLYCFNSFLRPPPPPSQTPNQVSSFNGNSALNNSYIKRGVRNRRKRSNSRYVVLSTHSNPKILKSNKKSPYCTDDEEDKEDEEEEEEFDDDEDDFPRDDWLFYDDFAETSEYDVNGKRFKSKKAKNRQGSKRRHEKHQGSNTLKSRKGLINAENVNNVPKKTSVRNYPTSEEMNEVSSLGINGRGKLAPRTSTGKENRYERLSDEIVLDKKWIPLLDYLSTFGLKESHFMHMYERHMTSLQTNVCSAQERLEYLLSVGVKQRDIRRILLRQPKILEYTVENNLKSHVAFLKGLGIPNSRVGQIIAAAPSLFSYSVENSLKPTVRYLIEEVGIKEKDLGKVVQLSPQILVQRIDISWNTRYLFLSEQLGAPRDSVVKMVTKHPQLLHYSIDDGLLPRINFLRSIGMHNSDILKVLTSLTQVLSLSLEENLKPKYMYLINELNNEVHSLTKYPMYLSLSLYQRIRPRHLFLVALKKVPKGPFPLSSLVPTDECFCQQWAGTNVDKYLAFRQGLLLKEFAKNMKRKDNVLL